MKWKTFYRLKSLKSFGSLSDLWYNDVLYCFSVSTSDKMYFFVLLRMNDFSNMTRIYFLQYINTPLD